MNSEEFVAWINQDLPKGCLNTSVLRKFAGVYFGPDPDQWKWDDEEPIDTSLDGLSSLAKVKHRLFSRNLGKSHLAHLSDSGYLGIIGLQLASLGVSTAADIRSEAYLRGSMEYLFAARNVMELVASVNLNRVMALHPDFDLAGLLQRIKSAVDSGDFHDFWDRGYERNAQYPIADRTKVVDKESEYFASVILSHYAGARLPPDLSARVTAEGIRQLVSFETGSEWEAAFAQLHDKTRNHGFSMAFLFRKMIAIAVPLAKHAGLDQGQIAKRIGDMFDALRRKASPLNTVEQAFRRTTLMHVLWDAPDSWGQYGLEAGDLYGVHYKDYDWCKERQSTERVYFDEPFLPWAKQGGTAGSRLVDALARRYPELYDPNMIARRRATNSPKWFKRITDWEPAREVINDMMAKGLWHYALQGDRLSHLFEFESSKAALMTYLQTGGNACQKRASVAIGHHPEIVEVVAKDISRVSEAKRLAAVARLTSTHLQGLKPALRDAVLAVSLGV